MLRLAMFLALAVSGGAALAASAADRDAVIEIARDSQCISHNWKQRGVAPPSYIEGMALVFARAACHPERADVREVSAADSGHLKTDALTVYKDRFAQLGMRNDADGAETLRHSYALLIGLGMMESSGKYCEGRDVSQCFAAADSAESGLFQTSFGVGSSRPVLMALFADYRAGKRDCLLGSFQDHLTCKIRKSHNTACAGETSDVSGTGEGADWQRLTKTCPAFAAEYAAVVLRQSGGSKGEFNPIRKRQAEVLGVCDSMLADVQTYVENHPEACSSF